MGVSVSTMRQWCATGRVRTEQVTRDSVHTIRVHLDQTSGTRHPTGQPAPPADAPPDAPPDAPSEPVERHVPDARMADASLAESRAFTSQEQAATTLALVSSTASQFLAPFIAELTATRELSERQSLELRSQAELIGRLSSDLDQARATVDELRTSAARRRVADFRVTLILVMFGTLLVAGISAGAAWWFGH